MEAEDRQADAKSSLHRDPVDGGPGGGWGQRSSPKEEEEDAGQKGSS